MYGVSSYPTLKFFPPKAKTNGVVDYSGPRERDSLVTFAIEERINYFPPSPKELIN